VIGLFFLELTVFNHLLVSLHCRLVVRILINFIDSNLFIDLFTDFFPAGYIIMPVGLFVL